MRFPRFYIYVVAAVVCMIVSLILYQLSKVPADVRQIDCSQSALKELQKQIDASESSMDLTEFDRLRQQQLECQKIIN